MLFVWAVARITVPTLETDQASSKQILIEEIIAKLKHFAQLYGINSIFVVGGYCREHYLGSTWKTNDIDVASAYQDQALQLGGLFASEVLGVAPRFYERTGTAMIEYASDVGTIKIEFQSDSVNAYMHSEDVKEWMRQQGIDDVPLMNNIYGRDFTINSLIYSLHNGNMYDPTDLAVQDFQRRSINSLLPAEMLIKYNPLAALRAVRFAIQYNFRVDSTLRQAIKAAGVDNLRASLSEERIVQEIVKILKLKAEEGLKMLKNLELDRILLNPDVKRYLELGSKREQNDQN